MYWRWLRLSVFDSSWPKGVPCPRSNLTSAWLCSQSAPRSTLPSSHGYFCAVTRYPGERRRWSTPTNCCWRCWLWETSTPRTPSSKTFPRWDMRSWMRSWSEGSSIARRSYSSTSSRCRSSTRPVSRTMGKSTTSGNSRSGRDGSFTSAISSKSGSRSITSPSKECDRRPSQRLRRQPPPYVSV
ncbi:hypothetical protein D9M68_472900 [compost metagenome]